MSSELIQHDIHLLVDSDPGPRAGAKRSLLDIVPAPVGADAEKLEAAAARHRVLIWRGGAVIAVTTLISVGGALLIHALAAGVLVIGFWFPGWMGIKPGGRTNLAGPADAGGSLGGFSILGDGPDDNAPPAPQLAEILGNSPHGFGGLPLPSLPEQTAPQMAAQLAAPAEALPVVSGDLGSVLIVRANSPAALPDLVRVEPPTAVVTGPAELGGTPGLPARGTGAGNGGGDQDSIFPLLKGDGTGGSGSGGVGTGSGKGRGSGVDRGLSAADREAKLLELGPGFSIPLQYQMKPPEKNVDMVIVLASDGSITAVKLERSCGVSDIDRMVCDYVKAYFRFSPAYRAGKAIPSDFPFTYAFKPFD